jgi:hypothetical protein
MRNIIAAAALLFFSSMSVGLADAPVSGKVVKVDPSARTFTAQFLTTYKNRHNEIKNISRERTYKTTDKTVYTIGSAKGAWSDLKKGVHVNVTAHAGVAENVQISGS